MAIELVQSNNNRDTLRAALDEIDVGIVLLDSNLNPQFFNRAFLRIYRVTDASVVAKLNFEGLLRLVVGKRRYLSSPAKFNAYIHKTTTLVRTGVENARDVRMDDGKVIRVKCKPLPDGGRMLVYADVTDLVQQADNLKELSMVDGMTGIFNRRHFLSLAEIEWSRYQRYKCSLSLLMIDIDHFKSINDTFGHDVGDQVIVQVADICRCQKRKSDVVARFGGEEFLILLPENNLKNACVVAQRLREQIAAQDLLPTPPINATVSIGVAEANSKMSSIFNLIKLADQAMYEAKNSGRNRVCSIGR